MKVIVIGCTHAGTAAIMEMRRRFSGLDKSDKLEIKVYEKNDNISFLSCGIALYVGGVVKDVNGLFYNSPENLKKLGIDTKMQHDILSVDLKNKTLQVKNLQTGQEFQDNFDKLVITAGSWPIIPNLEGINLENVLLCKNFDHAKTIIEKSEAVENITVIGAGYIGVELAEAFRQKNKNVNLIDGSSRIMSKYLDKEFTDIAEKSLTENKVKLALGEKVLKFNGENNKVAEVITDKGTYKSDLVIMCVGFRPNTDIFRNQLDMLENGAIVVDKFMKTSDPDVLAAGDCTAQFFNPTSSQKYIPLATNAVRMGTLAGINLTENKVSYRGTQATSGIKIFDENFAATGLTEEEARKENLEVLSASIKENYRPEFMPTYAEVLLKIVYDKKTKIICGAQLNSKFDCTQIINTLSVCIQSKMTIEDLAFVDQFFQPHFNKPWGLINAVGLKALE